MRRCRTFLAGRENGEIILTWQVFIIIMKTCHFQLSIILAILAVRFHQGKSWQNRTGSYQLDKQLAALNGI